MLFHTSDWHLGRMLYGRSLLEDQRYFLERQFLPAVEQERPSCVILAGDLYDRQIAPPEAIRLLDMTLSRLTELSCKVCLISGNHDGAERIAILKGILRQNGVYLSTCLEDAFSPVLLEQGADKIQLFLLPYFDSSQARDFLGDERLRGEAACMEKLLEKMVPLFDPNAAHVLVSHCFVGGSHVSDSESAVFVGGSGEIPSSLFEPFDYVALGHLHAPQRAGSKARYSGSPLKYSLDESGQRKSFLRLNYESGCFSVEEVPISPLREVKRLSGLFEEFLRQGENSRCEDYVELCLEDKEPVLMAAERLRPFYPNLLTISGSWNAFTVSGARAARLRGENEATVFSSFFREVCGLSVEEEDLELFREVWKEVSA